MKERNQALSILVVDTSSDYAARLFASCFEGAGEGVSVEASGKQVVIEGPAWVLEQIISGIQAETGGVPVDYYTLGAGGEA